MNEENELAKLEGFVSTLLERFNGLQSDNKELNDRLQRRDASIETLEGEIASMKDERGEISSRVSGLIGKIEEWESTITAVETTATAEDVESEAESESETDSDFDAEEEAEDVKKDSGVQGNLFNVEATGE